MDRRRKYQIIPSITDDGRIMKYLSNESVSHAVCFPTKRYFHNFYVKASRAPVSIKISLYQ